MHDLIVVGGGLAGIVAALRCAEAGLRPLLLEAAERAGGRIAGGPTVAVRHQGREWPFPAEHGIHGIWGQYHNLRALLAQYQLDGALVAARREDWLHGEGERVLRAEAGSMVRRSPIPAPFHYLGLFARPSFWPMLTWRDLIGLPRVAGSLFIALAYDPLIEPAPLAGRTLAGLFRHWPPRLRAFLSALMRSGLAAHPEEVPLGGFLAFVRFYTLLRRDAWAFSYLPADSDTSLIAPLLSALQGHGGTFQANTSVEALARHPDHEGWQVAYRCADGTSGTLDAKTVIVALDAPAAQQLLSQSAATAPVAARLRWPHGLGTGIVRLWYGAAPENGAESGICSGDFTIDNFFWLHHFQREPAAFHRATGGSVVEAHIYGPQELLDQPDEVLIARVVADFARAYPELRDHLLHTTFQRNRASHTRFETGADPAYLGVVTPWPDLIACGDWIRYPHPALFLERATVTGLAAANEALRLRGLPAPPILPAAPPEPLAAVLGGLLRGVRRLARTGRPRPKQRR